MLRPLLIVVAAAAIALPVTLSKPALANKEAAVAAGAAIGLALGAIIAKKRQNRRHEDQWHYINQGASFSPARGVVCFPNQRACYRNNYYSADWSHRVYGY